MTSVIENVIPDLLTDIVKQPHWRVNFRPNRYDPGLIPTLSECLKLVEQCRVSLRGWDFPHLSYEIEQRELADNYIASWVHFADKMEYWRFYQSGQFLHLYSVTEAISKKWHKKLEANTRSHLRSKKNVDWSRINGYLDLMNFFYRIVEIIEFATRLCLKEVYREYLTMTIELKNIKNFVLTTDWERSWDTLYQCRQDTMGNTWTFPFLRLIAGGSEVSVEIAKWFFEQFGWMSPPEAFLERTQQSFLAGRL